MTKVEIAVSVGVTIWMIIAIVLAVGLHKLVKPEYRKFYPHPSVGVILDNKYDYRLNKREKAFCNIVSIIVFIPITFEWVVGWCLYKLGGAVYKFIKEADEKANEEAERRAKELEKIYDDMFEELEEAVVLITESKVVAADEIEFCAICILLIHKSFLKVCLSCCVSVCLSLHISHIFTLKILCCKLFISA